MADIGGTSRYEHEIVVGRQQRSPRASLMPVMRSDIDPGAPARPRRRRRPGALAATAILLFSTLVLGGMVPRSEAAVGRGATAAEPSPHYRKQDCRSGMTAPTCKCPFDSKDPSNVNEWVNCTCANQVLRCLREGEGANEASTDDPSKNKPCGSSNNCCEFDCYDAGLTCTNGTCSCVSPDDDTFCSEIDLRIQFMTAAQIALGAALVVAIMALAVLVWKMCYRPGDGAWARGLRRGGGMFFALPFSGSRNRGDSNDDGSTNSIQNFVIQKMRDRPPRYDDAPPEMPPDYSDIVGSPSDGADGSPVLVYVAAVQQRPGRGEPAPPYDAGDFQGAGGSRSAGSRRRADPSRASTGDANNDISDGVVNGNIDSHGSAMACNTVADGEPEQDGIDNPAFVHEVYEHHM